MPDDKAKLTDEEKAQVVTWLESRWAGGLACSVCNSRQWSVADHMIAPLLMDGKSTILATGPVYPQVMVICTNCGHTLYFNAPMMGLVKGKAQEEENVK